jgi:hypothetical protein
MARSGNASAETFSASGEYWSPDLESGKWDRKVWKWREFLGCGSVHADSIDAYNYARSSGNGIEMGLLTPPDMDWVYVSGVSVGSVWEDLVPSYQPLPLRIKDVSSLKLETKIAEWKGAPLSPVIFPSWYAVLTDVWFNVTNVVIEDENGREEFPSKILGMDIFYHTMTGSLNVVMNAGSEFSRVEPCNNNFIYSVNLAGQDFYTMDDGFYTVDLMALLERAQEEASRKGWYFDIANAELVMFENVIESYWSYAYAKINWTAIRYCRECAID